MKKIAVIFLAIAILAAPIFARDFETAYQEARAEYRKATFKMYAAMVSAVALTLVGGVATVIDPDNMILVLSGAAVAVGGLLWLVYGVLANAAPDQLEAGDKVRRLEHLKNNSENYNTQEINSIINGTIFIGMSESALIACWGKPRDVNKSVGEWGTHKQYVYGDFGPYVYVENGYVTSWQS